MQPRPPGSAAPRQSLDRSAPASARLTHLDAQGKAHMVDIGDKDVTRREAVARGSVRMKKETLAAISDGAVAKGDVLAVARVAGILAAKRTHELIPLCHPLQITQVVVELIPDPARSRLDIEARVRVDGKTGVEMEALTAVTVAALTVYDMAKAIDRGMRIEGVKLWSKTGGKSGEWRRQRGRS